MIKRVFFSALFFCFVLPLSAQNRKFPSLEQKIKELEQIKSSLNALCHSVLDTILKPETESATRMEYMFFLGKLRCDSCENYIIEHLTEIWNIDDMDYRNSSTPFRTAVISTKAEGEYGRWNIVRLAWLGLTQKKRDDEYLTEINVLLGQYVFNLDSTLFITFIENEIRLNEQLYGNTILATNLKSMLQILQPDKK